MSKGDPLVRVAEIFGPTIQGEGADIGRLCYFVRFGGCDYRCSWCDSMHAVEPDLVRQAWQMTEVSIYENLQARMKVRPADYVVLSGGNPAVWDLGTLTSMLQSNGIKVAVETQGSIPREWLKTVNRLTVSPKPPSSRMINTREDLEKFFKELWEPGEEVFPKIVLKVVVFTPGDMTYAKSVHVDYPDVPFYISIGTKPRDTTSDIVNRTKMVLDWTSEFPEFKDTHILPQLHAILWGHDIGH